MNKLDLSDNKNRLLPKMLTLQAEQAGNTEFLITDERRLTFAEAELVANSMAAGLLELGVGRGDRVAFLLDNGWEPVLVALAVNKIGAIWVPINTDYKGSWLSDTIQRSRCSVLITETALQDRIVEVVDQLPPVKWIIKGDSSQFKLQGATSFDALCDHAPLKPDYSGMSYGDTCAILWTSGTTGKSKGVLQSHNSWIRPIAEAASIYFDSREGDVIYNVLPLYNSGAWITAIFRALYEGIPVVIEKRFSVSTFWDRIRQFKATQTFTLGAMHMFLWNAPPQAADRDHTLRVAQMVPMPEQLREPFSQRFGVDLLPMGMGQSEALVIFTPAHHMGKIPFASLGHPLPDMEIELVDDEGNLVAEGEIGEVCVKCLKPHIIFNGYFDDEAATAEAWQGDRYHTGDMAKFAGGTYWFVDRKKDALRFAGRNISSMEVEMMFRKHPAVKDVAAYGIPSQMAQGESELAVQVVLKPDAKISYEEMAEFVNDNAPYYFVPQYMEFVETLPYTPTNKVQKYRLRDQGVGPNTWVLKNSGYKVKR